MRYPYFLVMISAIILFNILCHSDYFVDAGKKKSLYVMNNGPGQLCYEEKKGGKKKKKIMMKAGCCKKKKKCCGGGGYG